MDGRHNSAMASGETRHVGSTSTGRTPNARSGQIPNAFPKHPMAPHCHSKKREEIYRSCYALIGITPDMNGRMWRSASMPKTAAVSMQDCDKTTGAWSQIR
jgi:hypothetical protein